MDKYKFLASSLMLVIFANMSFSSYTYAQDSSGKKEVRVVIDRLFDGMRAGDSTMVRSVFYSDVRMASISNEGEATLTEAPVERFVRAVGTPHDKQWDERIYDVKIRVDGNMATAWVPFVFYHGGEKSHCGVNAFQLFKTKEDGWKVINITDTRKSNKCPEI